MRICTYDGGAICYGVSEIVGFTFGVIFFTEILLSIKVPGHSFLSMEAEGNVCNLHVGCGASFGP
jgi:hypothetical protein